MSRYAVAAGLFAFALVLSPVCVRSALAAGFALDAKAEVSAFTAVVEADFDGALGGARALAATTDARSGDWERIKEPLSAYASSVPWAAAVWFARPDGSYYTLEKGLTGQSIKDRTYFPQLMAGQTITGELVVSHSTGRKSVVIAAPVVVDGRIIGAIGVSVAVEALAKRLDAQLQLPPNIVFYALDGQGRTALHREGGLIFDYPTGQGSSTLTAAVRTMLSQSEGVVHYQFRKTVRVAAFRRSKRLGWVFVIVHVRRL